VKKQLSWECKFFFFDPFGVRLVWVVGLPRRYKLFRLTTGQCSNTVMLKLMKISYLIHALCLREKVILFHTGVCKFKIVSSMFLDRFS